MNHARPETTIPLAASRSRSVRAGVVGAVRAFLVALALVMSLAPASAQDRKPPRVELLPPLITSPQALVLRAEASDASGVGEVTFWVRRGRTAYRPVPAQRRRDGTWGTRLMWFGGSKEVRFYVEAKDKLGNGPVIVGDETTPFYAYFSRESYKPKPVSKTKMAVVALIVAVASLCTFRWMLRQDRLCRIRNYWFRVLAPLIWKHGQEAVREVDRLAANAPRPAFADESGSRRLHAMRWLTRLRKFAGVRRQWPSARSTRRPAVRRSREALPRRQPRKLA